MTYKICGTIFAFMIETLFLVGAAIFFGETEWTPLRAFVLVLLAMVFLFLLCIREAREGAKRNG